jgi:hypothetical protein
MLPTLYHLKIIRDTTCVDGARLGDHLQAANTRPTMLMTFNAGMVTLRPGPHNAGEPAMLAAAIKTEPPARITSYNKCSIK